MGSQLSQLHLAKTETYQAKETKTKN